MPMRNYSFESSVGSSDLVKLRDLSSQEGNVFDKEFNAELDMKDWNDWMRCEGNINQVDSAMLIDRKPSIASTASWLEGISSSNNDRAVEKDAVFSSLLNNNEFSFEDALLDFDEVPQPPCYNLPIGSSFTNANTNTDTTSSLSLSKDNFNFNNNRAPQEVTTRSNRRGFSSLTEAEERSLTEIAMPYHTQNTKRKTRPTASTDPSTTEGEYTDTSPSPSPSPTTRKSRTNKKRKSTSSSNTADAESLCQSRKTGHNMIEKRYRTNLNEKIDCLRQSVPAFPRRGSAGSDGEDMDEGEDGGSSKLGRQKYGKAAILTRACEYIKHLENTTQRLGGEVDLLKGRVGAFEKLAMSGSMVLQDRVGFVVAGGLGLGLVESETLESIRNDFKQVGLKYRPVPGPVATRRRNSRQTKVDAS